MSLEQIAQRTAAKVYFSELAAARALGYPGVDAYISAFRCLDQVYAMAFLPEKATVVGRFKTIGRKS